MVSRNVLRTLAAVALAALATPAVLAAQAPRERVLILVVDGLRPDYVTPALMPRLDALARSGVRGARHHAVFPTVTRVNAPSIFTGRYPGGHGLMGNSVYMPEVDPERVLSASDARNLRAIDDATGGRLLTAPSLGELLAERGRVLFAASSGSTGSATLMNPRGAGAGLVHHETTIPDTLASVVTEVLGPPPTVPEGGPEIALVARVVDAILRIGVDRADADVLAGWLTEPDGTAHDHGIGAPETVAVLRGVDAQIGRLLDGLEERGVLAHTNVLVVSDHGFSTRAGEQSLTALLVAAGLKEAPTSTDVVVADGAIHVREGGKERIARIVRVLQETPWVGAVFTRPRTAGSDDGVIPGTLSHHAVRWDHERSADILVSPDWTDDPNAYGWPGTAAQPGVAGHGTASPWDVRATFLAAGPAIKGGVASQVPTGNVDITPTTLHLLGVPVPADLDGRVLLEVLRDGPDPSGVTVVSVPASAEVDLGGLGYRLTADRVRVDGTLYFDGARVERVGRDPS